MSLHLYLNILSNKMHGIRPNGLACWAFDRRAGFQVEARVVSTAGDDRALDRSVCKPHAIMGADIVNGKQAFADTKNRQPSVAHTDGYSSTFGEIRQCADENASGHSAGVGD